MKQMCLEPYWNYRLGLSAKIPKKKNITRGKPSATGKNICIYIYLSMYVNALGHFINFLLKPSAGSPHKYFKQTKTLTLILKNVL